MGAEMGGMQPQAKDAWSPQELEEAGRTLPRRLFGGISVLGPLEPSWDPRTSDM